MQNSWPKVSDPVQVPKPELNPLLNPLLEQNLGRWAQVYFTNPPETREQAVADLLRELNAEASGRVAPRAPAAQPSAQPAGEKVVCPACDGENRPNQRFCGFCGTLLRSKEPTAAPRTRFAEAPAHADNEPESLSFLGLSDTGYSAPDPKPAQENDLQFLRMKDFGSEYYEPSRSPLRRYLVAGTVLVLAAAVYIEWPWVHSHLSGSTQSSTSVSAPANAAPNTPSQTTPPPAQPTASGPSSVSSSTSSSSSSTSSSAAGPSSAAPSSAQTQSEDKSAADAAQSRPATHEVTDSSLNISSAPVPASMASRSRNGKLPSDSAGSAADGAQELFLAQRYLAGKGEPRDSSTAARWLWKSVGKQNAHAAMLLADLYERGDGVSKSCGQARILLGVAEQKGVPAASQKLRDLESSGCR